MLSYQWIGIRSSFQTNGFVIISPHLIDKLSYFSLKDAVIAQFNTHQAFNLETAVGS